VQRVRALILAPLLLLGGCAVEEPGLRLVFAGDVLLSREVAVEIEATGGSPWDSIAPYLAGADWAFANLEGAFGAARECRTPAGAPCFAFADSTAGFLAAAGFDALSLENNHAGDLGPAGRQRTHTALAARGILGVDFEHSPRFFRVGERTIALIAISLVPGADGIVHELPSIALAQQLRLASTLADLVVVSVHWGRELHDRPSKEQEEGAEWLVSQGADLVIGHHPHVVQSPACVLGRPVFFSLGNHVFDQRYPETKLGLIADCTLKGDRLTCAGVETEARRGSSVPVLRDSIESDALDGCDVRLLPPLEMRGFRIRPSPSIAGGAGGDLVLEGWRDGELKWQTRRVRVAAMEVGVATEGGERLLLTLEHHPSDFDNVVALRPHVYDVGTNGLIARWRGTALAWPLLDALLDEEGELCALHRGDSFLRPDPTDRSRRVMHYRWNGFGFSATGDSAAGRACLARWPSPQV
jgi:hypothetical protein